MLAACAPPAARVDEQAAHLGLHRELVRGSSFSHVLYVNAIRGGERLHVYLGGDGRPWRRIDRVSANPDSPHALMLDLLAVDTRPALFLGRPCYHGLAQTARCSPWYWTMGRYAASVVESLQQVVRERLDAGGYDELVLIGHSGGGTLAMLLAARLPETVAVVTLAGNLDTSAWSALHGYSPLSGSLNPAREPPLPVSIRQFHLLGGRDATVPPALTGAAVARWENVHLLYYPDFDHRCCWRRAWPAMLRRLERIRH